jgi:gamma-glutamylcyclotransferase (GGCT)/AIG2-like uncharacterized protein YtfP
MAERLFVYGTLRPDRAPKEIAGIVERLTPVSAGSIRARLYDFGDYPGIVLDESAGATVDGEIFALPADRKTLQQLDAYEEYSPQNSEGSLFKRIKTAVTLKNGTQQMCWVYVYNQALPKTA